MSSINNRHSGIDFKKIGSQLSENLDLPRYISKNYGFTEERTQKNPQAGLVRSKPVNPAISTHFQIFYRRLLAEGLASASFHRATRTKASVRRDAFGAVTSVSYSHRLDLSQFADVKRAIDLRYLPLLPEQSHYAEALISQEGEALRKFLNTPSASIHNSFLKMSHFLTQLSHRISDINNFMPHELSGSLREQLDGTIKIDPFIYIGTPEKTHLSRNFFGARHLYQVHVHPSRDNKLSAHLSQADDKYLLNAWMNAQSKFGAHTLQSLTLASITRDGRIIANTVFGSASAPNITTKIYSLYNETHNFLGAACEIGSRTGEGHFITRIYDNLNKLGGHPQPWIGSVAKEIPIKIYQHARKII